MQEGQGRGRGRLQGRQEQGGPGPPLLAPGRTATSEATRPRSAGACPSTQRRACLLYTSDAADDM
eukprot:6055019-Alexandrium_andersonii.AAC.1